MEEREKLSFPREFGTGEIFCMGSGNKRMMQRKMM